MNKLNNLIITVQINDKNYSILLTLLIIKSPLVIFHNIFLIFYIFWFFLIRNKNILQLTLDYSYLPLVQVKVLSSTITLHNSYLFLIISIEFIEHILIC